MLPRLRLPVNSVLFFRPAEMANEVDRILQYLTIILLATIAITEMTDKVDLILQSLVIILSCVLTVLVAIAHNFHTVHASPP
ncbi:hypothetical protein LENED_011361 [Lentinula edodes]|uniref:Uncharacterized protein n=1 Tax=Lentinula edodes TaxID=5353 RepID=A0A1Q3EPU1_LENED|nr:hypothetical protein LENED_011361 [Lentinula edodes]